MGFTDRLKDLKGKAEDAAAEHNDQIRGAIQKAAATADQKTGGRYSEKIEQAGAKADTFVGGLKDAGKDTDGEAEQAPAE
jgi:MT0933-like antitoxin protein